MASPARKGMKPSRFVELYETARIDVEMAKLGYVREIEKLDSVEAFLDEVYEALIGQAPPAFKPEFRIVKAA